MSKSAMESWAEQEVALACAAARGDGYPGEWDYGVACYEVALKAFKAMLGQGVSGAAMGFVKPILNRLIDAQPLTPIEDTDDIWSAVPEAEPSLFQCKRMRSLFKRVYPDGTVKYSDHSRYYCFDEDDPSDAYTTGIVEDILDEMFPVTVPYYPQSKIKVCCETFLADVNNGCFDMRGVLYAIVPDGERAKRVDIYRYYDGRGDGWKEIDIGKFYTVKEEGLRAAVG